MEFAIVASLYIRPDTCQLEGKYAACDLQSKPRVR